MRLIDADRLSEAIYDNVSAPYEEAVWAKEDCLTEIDVAPTVDAVHVVRCSECKSYNKPRTGWCEVHLDTEPSNGYCYWGKPKDGDGNEP